MTILEHYAKVSLSTGCYYCNNPSLYYVQENIHTSFHACDLRLCFLDFPYSFPRYTANGKQFSLWHS